MRLRQDYDQPEETNASDREGVRGHSAHGSMDVFGREEYKKCYPELFFKKLRVITRKIVTFAISLYVSATYMNLYHMI